MGREIHVLRVTTDSVTSLPTAEQLAQASEELTVSTATGEAEATELIASQSVDCVVCDATVGSTCGVDLLDGLRKQTPAVPFFLVLTPGAETTVCDALAAGVTDCINAETLADQSNQAAEVTLIGNRIRAAVTRAATHELEVTHEELVASEVKYRSLIEDVLNISHVGTFILDASFSVVWINDRIETYFGVDRADVLGKDKRELIDGRIKHIFEDPERFADRVIATYDDNTYVEQFECHVLPSVDRTERWLEHGSYPIRNGPYAGGRIEHYVDITARRRREAELTAERQLLDRLFETSPVGIALLDPTGEIIRTNNHGEAVLGAAASTVTDRSYDDTDWNIHDENGEPIPSEQLPFARVRRSGQPVSGFEHGIVLPDGERRWLSINAAPLTADDGSVDRVIYAIRDMTEIRASERTLERQNAQLGEFASIVSHDLRNPLNVLSGSLELAEETGEAVHFERARRAVDRMETLIEDLLSLARHGEGIDHTEAVDLGELARSCWTTLETAEATLRIDTDTVITADRSRLEQLLENLFRNSVEHGGSGVTITVGTLPDGFVIADNGTGIPADTRESIFERGFSTRRDGTGLGLSIVTQIAAAHGWNVGLADSEVGTRIEVTGVERHSVD